MAPDFALTDSDGQEWSLASFDNCKGLVVLFTCNHCPQSRQAWPVITKLQQRFRPQVCFVAFNSDDDQKFPEDSLELMDEAKLENQIKFPYLQDDTQDVARAYQAQCLPECFVFKNKGRQQFSLFYHGRIVDNLAEPSASLDLGLEIALNRLVTDRDPQVLQKSAFGCEISWKSAS
jgi:peroxiredoxin